ncbi:hypothetical protein RCO48_26525 [Peribacillus frigoritolerans]|nr:hypothetical protein [Peribacillus frigoritolerans]
MRYLYGCNGCFTTDPRYIKGARKLQSISYDEMLELANLGAGVLHPRAVEYAKNYQIPLEVRSSMERESGTIIEEEATMEENLIVRGIAFEDSITRVTIYGLPQSLGALSTIFTTLAKKPDQCGHHHSKHDCRGYDKSIFFHKK